MYITFTFYTCFVVRYANMPLQHTTNFKCLKMTVFSSIIIIIILSFFFSFSQTMMGLSPRCYISSFVEISPPVPEKIFEGFCYHIWAWQPSRPCETDATNKLSLPLPKEAPHKIWL